MRVEFHLLSWPVSPAFQAMTYGIHAPLLAQTTAPEGHLALGVLGDGAPLGFGLARETNRAGEILSLFVEPTCWGKGIGTRLLEELERGLVGRGCRGAGLGYTTESPSAPALERVLAKRGWSAPVTSMILAQLDPEFPVFPSLRRLTLGGKLELFPWGELTAEERAALFSVQAEIDPALWPFSEEATIDPECSLGVRCGGQVAGWVIVHRVAPTLLRLTALYLREPWRTSKGSMALLAAACLRKEHRYGAAATMVFAIQIENEPMRRLLERKFRPAMRAIHEARRAWKKLA